MIVYNPGGTPHPCDGHLTFFATDRINTYYHLNLWVRVKINYPMLQIPNPDWIDENPMGA